MDKKTQNLIDFVTILVTGALFGLYMMDLPNALAMPVIALGAFGAVAMQTVKFAFARKSEGV